MPTLNLSIDVPSTREVDDFAVYHGWTAELGVAKAVFCKRVVINFIRESIKAQRSLAASETARLQEVQNADNLVIT